MILWVLNVGQFSAKELLNSFYREPSDGLRSVSNGFCERQWRLLDGEKEKGADWRLHWINVCSQVTGAGCHLSNSFIENTQRVKPTCRPLGQTGWKGGSERAVEEMEIFISSQVGSAGVTPSLELLN